MTPSAPTRVALALLAACVGAIAGCGGSDNDAPRVADGCSDTHSSVPIAAAELDPDGRTLRFAYGGDLEPCHFAASLYDGTLYVELRRDEDSEAAPGEPDCAVAHLDKALPAGTHASPITAGSPGFSEAEGKELLHSDPDCIEVPEGDPDFVIN